MTLEMTCRPLSTWEGTYTPAEQRVEAPFGGNWSMSLDKLEHELDHLGADRCVMELTTGDPHRAIKIRIDGWPHANQAIAPPVRVAFPTAEQGWLQFQSDRYRHWQSKVHAVALTLEHLRAVERYGTVSKSEQYRGFAALPASAGSVPDPIQQLANLVGATVQNVATEAREAMHLEMETPLKPPTEETPNDHPTV